MGKFENINEDELMAVEGGNALAIAVNIAAILGGYLVIREMVKDAGRAAAYEDLGY